MDLSQEVSRGSVESQSPWKVKEAQILEGLDKKVRIVTAFSKELDTCTLEDPPDIVQQRLHNFSSSVSEQFPPEVIDGYQKYQVLNTRIKATTSDTRHVGSDWEDVEERERLLQNPDVLFLVTMRQIIDDLVRKNQQVHNFMAKPDTLKPILAKLGERGFALDKAKDIRYQPFSITFIVDRPDLPPSADYAGLHFGETPFNIALDRGVETERIVQHEEIHNRIDGAQVLESVDPHEFVKGRFKRYEKANPIMARLIKTDVMKLQPAQLIDYLQNEMLAQVQTAEADSFQINYTDIAQTTGIGEETIKWMLGNSNSSDLSRYTQILATAGVRMSSLLNFLGQQADTAKDPEIREYSRSLRKKVEDIFVGSVANVEACLSIATRIGEDAHLATHMLLYVLKPSQYRHIDKFLRYKYGDTVVEAATESKTIGESLSFYPEGIEAFVTKAEKQKGKIAPIDKEGIEEQLTGFRVWDYDDLAIDLNSRQEYQVLLERAGGALGIDMTEHTPRILKGLTEATLFDAIEGDFKANFDHLPDIYKGLIDEDQEIFADMMGLYMASYILDELKETQGKEFTREELRATPHWNIVKQLGLEEKVEAAIQEEESRKQNTPKSSLL